MHPFALQTDRLHLRPWKGGDWVQLRPLATDPEVMRYINGGAPWTDERIQDFVERQARLYEQKGFCRWKLTLRENSEVIGFCGPGTWRDFPEYEIGWWLLRRYWGQGLATEAARAALRDAFERCGLKRLVSVAMPGNAASIRIMQKLGLSFECTFAADGVELVRHAITRVEYDRQRS